MGVKHKELKDVPKSNAS